MHCLVRCYEKVIGPFFENEEGQPERINGALYKTMLENFLRPAVEHNQEVWFQQDEAIAHTVRAMDLLREIFGEQTISKNAEFVCPRRSPDLTAVNFFLWGYLKERVNKPRIIQELKENIRVEIRRLEPETLRTVMENAVKRILICEQENDGHLKDVVFYT